MTASTVRAKFNVGSVKKCFAADGSCFAEEIEMYAVYSNDPESENGKFWTSTPTARLTMTVNNPNAWGTFRQGQEFYLDFTPAGEPVPV